MSYARLFQICNFVLFHYSWTKLSLFLYLLAIVWFDGLLYWWCQVISVCPTVSTPLQELLLSQNSLIVAFSFFLCSTYTNLYHCFKKTDLEVMNSIIAYSSWEISILIWSIAYWIIFCFITFTQDLKYSIKFFPSSRKFVVCILIVPLNFTWICIFSEYFRFFLCLSWIHQGHAKMGNRPPKSPKLGVNFIPGQKKNLDGAKNFIS